MTRNTERAFLALLIADDDSKEGCQLQASLAQAERDGKCIRRAVSLMLMFFLLAAGGLGYCAILLPAVFQNPSHLLMRSLSVLGLASLISQVVFVGYLLWHRAVVIGLHKECRLLALARSQLPAPPAANLAVDVQGPPLRTNPENHPSIPGSQHA